MAEMCFKSQSSPSSSGPGYIFDVFLSFRGEDTRNNFTSHLYTAFVQAAIHTFRDDKLARGETISQQLKKTIQESRISVVVFSRNYGFSRWCLDELVEIFECKRTIDQVVVPIFYDVDPSDVRNQTGSFKKAFKRHEKRFKEKVEQWRKALDEAGNLSGWHLKNEANGDESKLIQKIVEDVAIKLDRKYLNIAKYPVGIDSHVESVIALLSIDTNDVRIVGIHGMAGIGKTTIAKAIFNQLCYRFEGSCFLLNVKEISKRSNGLVQLQEQLLCDVLKSNTWKIENEDRGISLIKERLHLRRVFVVIDDVDQQKQVDVLLGEQCWLGDKSRILITSRNEHLLTQLGVDGKYQVEELNHDESLQLFSWHAFRDIHPLEDYMELSNDVIAYTKGLPLALEVLGSYLFKRGIPEWESAISELQKIPHPEILNKLKISFDTLGNNKQREVFLDIACFFIGKDQDYVAKILHARCGFNPEIIFRTLVERSLITIDANNELRMHDLLRDMGREIIREMSPDHPGNRSRICVHEDVLDVLNKQSGTDVVEGLALDVQEPKVVILSTKSFTRMRFLKLLQINCIHLTGSFEHLSKELIWLCWHNCPLKSFPSNFQLDSIVVLDMQHSRIRKLWKEIKFLNKLKILDLSYSKNLAKTPNFCSLSLEKLVLKGCSSLVEVHQSIGHLQSLVFLNLEGCCRLKILPQSICYLKSLKTLNITMCSQLEKLPDHLGNVESLAELLADGTAIQQLPSSIGRLKNLRILSLHGCRYKQDLPSSSLLSCFLSLLLPSGLSPKALLPSSFISLTSLTDLNLSYCGFLESEISVDFGSFSSLQELNFSGTKILNLPSGIGRLFKLKYLFIDFCPNLQSISELPSSLQALHAFNCASLERLVIQSKAMQALFLKGCNKLSEIQGVQDWWDDDTEELVQALCEGDQYYVILPIHRGLNFLCIAGNGNSVLFHVPEVSVGILKSMTCCAVFIAKERSSAYPRASAIIKNKSNNIILLKRSIVIAIHKTYTEHFWVTYIPITELLCPVEGGEELELSIKITDGNVIVETCGVHIYTRENAAEVWDIHGTGTPNVFSSSYESCDNDEGFLMKVNASSSSYGNRDSDEEFFTKVNTLLSLHGKFGSHGHADCFMEKARVRRGPIMEVENLSGWINETNGLDVAKYPVGINSRAADVISLLNVGKDIFDVKNISTIGVQIVAIHGMAGIGKTAVAKAMFNQLCDRFEGSCFLLNIKEISKRPNGRDQLQEQLLCDVLKSKVWKINTENRGINLIKELLQHKRVFVVLDDVDEQKQLDALLGDRSWFGAGSLIVITTRNENLLTQLGVDEKYEAKELNHDEALELFSWHAFRSIHPLKDYLELSIDVVACTSGLPLAIEVLGSYLLKRSKLEWESVIAKLQQIPHQEIQNKLRISFDALDDDNQKEIFLDIACFFIGRNKEYVAKIIHARSGLNPEVVFRTLIDRSLITIDFKNELSMHDLLRDMGREIIREMSADHLGNHSRIWCHEDVLSVVNEQMGTEVVEGLMLDAQASKVVTWSTESFSKMRYLKLLLINGVFLTGCYKHLSKELIWLCWHNCPLKSLPTEFQLDNVVILDMQYSNVKELWEEIKFLNKLKILDLSYSENLIKIPNIHSSSLEKLILEGCLSLVEVHHSIGHLKSLVFLNLAGCCRLKILSPSICELKSLKTLNVNMCSQLEKLPECVGDLESLSELLADGTAIQKLPSSVVLLKNLKNLSLCGYQFKQDLPFTYWLSLFPTWLSPSNSNSNAFLSASLGGLSSLRKLDVSYCGLCEGEIFVDFRSLLSLQEFNLSGNKIFNLPSGIGSLPKLKYLFVEDCQNLLSISELPSSLQTLHAFNCTSLRRLSIQSKTSQAFYLRGCEKLVEIQGVEGWMNADTKHLVQALRNGEQYYVLLPPGSGTQHVFTVNGYGSSVSFYVPMVSHGIFQAMNVAITFTAIERRPTYPRASVIIKNKRNDMKLFKRSTFLRFKGTSIDYHLFTYIPVTELQCALEDMEELELSVKINFGNVSVKKCVVDMIVRKPDGKWESRGTLIYLDDMDELEDLLA